jgi:hypothetical protein
MIPDVYSAGAAPLKQYILQVIEPVKPFSENQRCDTDALYWVGYIFRYCAYLTGMTSKQIIERISVEDALRCYPAYHCMGNKEAIERMLRMFSKQA